MGYVDFTVTGDPARAHATATEALEGRKFTLTWSDPWTGVAERGSKVGNVLAGAMAQYFKIGVRVMSAPTDGQAIVRIEQQSSGWMGGAIGAHRTKKNFAGLRDELRATFETAGVLVGVTEG